MKEIERRFLPVEEVRVVNEEGKKYIEGYAAVFDQRSEKLGGWFYEYVRKGAFTKTVKEADVRALFNHDPNFVLGRTKSGTLKLTQDDKGLKYRVLLPNTQAGKDLEESINRGDISGSSFGFRIVKDNWIKEKVQDVEIDVREIIEVKLFDVSPVTFPAYPQTSVGMRSLFEKNNIDFDSFSEIMAKKAVAVELRKEENEIYENGKNLMNRFLNPPESPLKGGRDVGDTASTGSAGGGEERNKTISDLRLRQAEGTEGHGKGKGEERNIEILRKRLEIVERE